MKVLIRDEIYLGKKEPRNAQHNQAARKVNRKSQQI